MEKMELQKLASVLKGNEVYLSDGIKKVSLTTHVLNEANKLIQEHIKQISISNPTCIGLIESNSDEVVQNIQLIYKLIQNTAYLKLINDVIDVDRPVDISDFKHLKVLEINKVDINGILGIQAMREHVQKLICNRCLKTLNALLDTCGGDCSSRYVWNELKELVLPYNKLKSLDSSLELTPWLHTLDISHNEITEADEISYLTNLKYLNISYNKFLKLPSFTGQICSRLQVLNASHNLLEDITGIQYLYNLCELDLSNNFLMENSALISLSHLATLQLLNLRDNPIAYYPNHSHSAASYLHSQVDAKKFVLNGQPLEKSDMKAIGTYHPLLQNRRPGRTSESRQSNENLMITSIDRLKKVRNVQIEDDKTANKTYSPLPESYSSLDHLEVKEHIQSLIQQHKEKWLNFYRYSGEEDIAEASNYWTPDTSVNFADFKDLTSSSKQASFKETTQSSATANNTNVLPEEEVIKEAALESIYNSNTVGEENSSEEDDDIDVSGEENIYLAKILGEVEEIFVVVTKNAISENECTTSKERVQWVNSTILKCEFVNGDHTKIKIDFDTLPKYKKQRIYEMQEEDCVKLHSLINNIIKKQGPKINKMYQCMKCSYKFTLNNSQMQYDKITCPKCQSTLIIEESSTSDIATD